MTDNVITHLHILDTETTGLKAPPNDQVIELSILKVTNTWLMKPVELFTKRYKPSVEINPFAQEVHGITLRELQNETPWEQLELPSDMEVLVAHNAAFDSKMLQVNKQATKVHCTMRLPQLLGVHVGQQLGQANNKLLTLYEHLTTLAAPYEAANRVSGDQDALTQLLNESGVGQLVESTELVKGYHTSLCDTLMCYMILKLTLLPLRGIYETPLEAMDFLEETYKLPKALSRAKKSTDDA